MVFRKRASASSLVAGLFEVSARWIMIALVKGGALSFKISVLFWDQRSLLGSVSFDSYNFLLQKTRVLKEVVRHLGVRGSFL